MWFSKKTLPAAIVFGLAVAFTSVAQAQRSPSVDQEVQQWIEKLDSPKFSERVEATRQLQRGGVDVIDPLADIVLRGNSDAADRAMGILKKHFEGGTPEVSDAAKVALQRIASTEGHGKASVAEKILTPETPEMQSPNARPQIQLAPPIRQANRISVSVKSVNGKREISVDENGRKFSFRDNGKGLQVDRPDDQGGVKTKQYKDEDELKKDDEEAFKIYKKYASGNGGGMQIQINGQNFGRGFGPGFGGGFPPGVLPPGFRPVPGIQVPPGMQQPNLQIPRQPLPPQQRPAGPQPPKQAEPDLIEV
ncbi:MAG: hypothetical protein WBD20_07830 [Pirellulaceae bacterium]